MTPLPELLTIRETAKVLRVGESTVRRLVDGGRLDGIYLGKRTLRIKGPSVARLLNEPDEATAATS